MEIDHEQPGVEIVILDVAHHRGDFEGSPVEAQFESLQAAAHFPESGDVLVLAVVGRCRKALSLDDKVRLVFRELAGSGEGGKQ